MCCIFGKQHAAVLRGLRFCTQQTQQTNARLLCSRKNLTADFDGIGVRCINTKIGPRQQSSHFLCVFSSAQHTAAWQLPHLLFAVFCGHANSNESAQGNQMFSQCAAVTCAAEQDNVHFLSYPRGVTMRPPTSCVLEEPINTVVNISSVSFA